MTDILGMIPWREYIRKSDCNQRFLYRRTPRDTIEMYNPDLDAPEWYDTLFDYNMLQPDEFIEVQRTEIDKELDHNSPPSFYPGVIIRGIEAQEHIDRYLEWYWKLVDKYRDVEGITEALKKYYASILGGGVPFDNILSVQSGTILDNDVFIAEGWLPDGWDGYDDSKKGMCFFDGQGFVHFSIYRDNGTDYGVEANPVFTDFLQAAWRRLRG